MEEKELFVAYFKSLGRNAEKIHDLITENKAIDTGNFIIEDVVPRLNKGGNMTEEDVRYLVKLSNAIKAITMVLSPKFDVLSSMMNKVNTNS